VQKTPQQILPFCTFMGPSPHPQHPPPPPQGLLEPWITLLPNTGTYSLCFNETAVNRFATVVLETFGDINGAAVLCVTLYGYGGVAYLYAENSARNNVSPAPREPGWLAGWLTRHILTRTAHPESGHRL
jgi:hypothetical protein